MYAAALLLAGSTTAGTTGLPYFHLGALNIGIPIQSFGVIVAAGVLIGAALLRRYAEWHGISDEEIRGLTGWITVSGFIGAHVFDVLFYQWNDLQQDPILLFKVWAGISSYGGFLGGAIGFAMYTWWKRLPVRLFADIAVVGLLPAFSIGRIGCTVVSDHIGAAVDPNAWYAGLAMDYPRNLNLGGLNDFYPGTSEFIKAWNLGLIEFLYLIPVNLLILWLAFRPAKRPNAGFLVVLTGVLYSPVRFGLDFLRPETTDPRYLGLTFAQWAALLMFGVAVFVAGKIFRTGKPAETLTRTSGEMQQRLKVVLKGDDDDDASKTKKAEPKKDKSETPTAKVAEVKVDLSKAEEEEMKADLKRKAADEKKAETKADEKKSDDKKSDDKKSDDKKSEAKSDDTKSDEKKSEKADDKKSDDA
jgi:phosphatidylglycerol:prolipoprotein diacylglycerol transferase